ncbi:MAG: alpha-lytic protease prodomain-containing protein [Micromonosporaceae bacterium]|nr:alpha-lytic protease prodomain-containing protein [Micromonosporaceae bacterium]
MQRVPPGARIPGNRLKVAPYHRGPPAHRHSAIFPFLYLSPSGGRIARSHLVISSEAPVRPTKALFIGVAATVAAAALSFAPAANASATLTLADAQTVQTLEARLGAQHTAGSYLDPASGRMVVAVTDTAAAQAVRTAGAVPKLVAHSSAKLNGVKADLDRSMWLSGTAWAVDPITDQVVVSVDDSVTGARLAQVRSALQRYGDTARLTHIAGVFRTFIAGGDAIYGGSARCSLGFNAQNSSGTQFFVTAGHCGNIAATWYANSSHTTVLGTRVVSVFPGSADYSIFQYTGSIARPGTVDLYNGTTRDITGAANPTLNQSVSRSGSTTGVHSGRVTALNQTVNYVGDGRVTGLTQTTVCAEPGDSGGPLFAGNTALGLTSGGSGNCTSGGVTFFQPVLEALNARSLTVY